MFVCLYFKQRLSLILPIEKETEKKNAEVTEKVMIVIIINAQQVFLTLLSADSEVFVERTGLGVKFN